MTASAPDRAAFVSALGGVAEHSPWVAEEAWRRGPFADDDALVAAFRAAIAEAPRSRQVALVRAHPDLAARAAIAGDLTASSATEQASAGLDRLTPDEHTRFQALNDAYRARFDFPFVICVRDHTRDSILAAFEDRLGNDRGTELAIALDQVARIVELRVRAARAS